MLVCQSFKIKFNKCGRGWSLHVWNTTITPH